MAQKQLKFGGQFANKTTQENVRMDVLRKSVITTILLRGMHTKSMQRRKVQQVVENMFGGHARRASMVSMGKQDNFRFQAPDEVTIDGIRKEPLSTDESPSTEFEVTISTSKLGFERVLIAKMESLQEDAEKFLAALQVELRAANALESKVVDGLRCRIKKVVLRDPTEKEERHMHVRSTKFFPTDSLDYFMNVKRLHVEKKAKEAKRITYSEKKKEALVDRFERWECPRCKNKNKLGTSVCAICRAASSSYQRNRLDPTKADHLPFHAEKCKTLKVEQVFAMHEDGVDFEERDGMGYTGLHCACHYGSLPLADAMLRCGAELEALTHDNWRPLHVAAHSGSAELVARLLKQGAEMNATTKTDGYAPIHFAAKFNHHDVLELLLEKGAHINLQTTLQMRTAMHFAAYDGYAESTQVLLDHDADMELCDDDGWKALALAQFRCNTEVASILVGKHAQQGDWEDATFNSAMRAAGWHTRVNPDFIIPPGSEGPLCLTRYHVPNKAGAIA
jgi:ankyrin repeat protein